MPFLQEGPTLTNPFQDNLVFSILENLSIPTTEEQKNQLHNFGAKVLSTYHPLSVLAETNPPEHVPFDPWGKRVDKITLHPSWTELQKLITKDGIVAMGYERKLGEHSRVFQMIHLAAIHPSSAFTTCPLAMTDGAARVLELHGDELDQDVFDRLTSKDPNHFWTSGQWMTERPGGSDVSKSETSASFKNNQYQLHGHKWFTSAVTSEISLALAQDQSAPNTKGLSLFLVHLRDQEGNLHNIEVQRLKDKLGTKALPTAELQLNGTPAKLLGKPGQGVKAISSILNITRMYNSACAVGTFHRGLLLAKDYAQKREAFGKKIRQHPAHVKTLFDLQALFEANLGLLVYTSHLLGKSELKTATPEEAMLLRLLTPILKLWTAKSAIASISEILECFGGAGYIEDTELPKLLRDSQVFSIWEGTTNVLALDVLRVLSKSENRTHLLNTLEEKFKHNQQPEIIDLIKKVKLFLTAMDEGDRSFTETNCRFFSFCLAKIFSSISFSDKKETPLLLSSLAQKKEFVSSSEISTMRSYLFDS